MTEKKNHKLFEAAFENTPELMNHDPYYIIKLDQLLRPDERIVVRTYCGTLDEISELISRLDADEWTRSYYDTTIAAWEAWQQGDRMALHHVGNSVVPLLTPAAEVCRSAYLLDEAEWNYIDKYDCTLRASADTVDVQQILLYSEYRYLRFARYHFTGLSRVHSDKGWVRHNIDDCRIPGMVYKTEDDMIHSWLYVFVEDYASKHRGEEAMHSDARVDYEEISQVLFVK